MTHDASNQVDPLELIAPAPDVDTTGYLERLRSAEHARSSSHQTYESMDPANDHRLRLAGSEWGQTGNSGLPLLTTSGEWMIPVILNLPYAMLASLEAQAQSHEIGDAIRAALVAAGHGGIEDIEGVRSDRFSTPAESKENAARVLSRYHR